MGRMPGAPRPPPTTSTTTPVRGPGTPTALPSAAKAVWRRRRISSGRLSGVRSVRGCSVVAIRNWSGAATTAWSISGGTAITGSSRSGARRPGGGEHPQESPRFTGFLTRTGPYGHDPTTGVPTGPATDGENRCANRWPTIPATTPGVS